MKHQLLILFILLMMSAGAWGKVTDIIPIPVNVTERQGSFRYSSRTRISADLPEANSMLQLFADKMRTLYGVRVIVSSGKAEISIHIDSTLNISSDEGYILTVDKKTVTIRAKSPRGAFYGLQSLIQLGTPAPCCRIEDYPRFGYRGFHLDPCRHFITVENVKKQIDLMALFKINTLHFHLTDDQGWRIEIKKYPRLIEVGATRKEVEGNTHTGYYTQEEIKDIVKYAADRHVMVIPEVDMPGHMMSAIAAYPELSCFNEVHTPRIIWGIEDIVLCPGKEMVYGFLEDVIKEVVPLFPSPYFHLGGDECRKGRWKQCPSCQATIAEKHLEADNCHTAEERLQSYFIKRMEKVVEKYGKKMIGWDEILEGGLSPNATVMSWRGEEGGVAAALQGHDVIMASSRNGLYLDYYQGDYRVEPVTIGNGTPFLLSKIYGYDPVPELLVKEGKDSHVIGVQGCSWSEYMYTNEKMEYMMYPRALALAEIAWSPLVRKNFDDFCRRADKACAQYLDKMNFTYHIPLPEQPNGSCNTVAFVDKVQLIFTTTRPLTMVYTLDGSMPTATSTIYSAPIELTRSTRVRIATLLSSGKMSQVRDVEVVKQPLQPACQVTGVQPGLILRRTKGFFHNISEVDQTAQDWSVCKIKSLKEMIDPTMKIEDMGRAKQGYVSIATGYVDIPTDGVYYWSADVEQVWLDGKLLISNSNEVKRCSRHDTSIALGKGLHTFKVVFMANISMGWPSWRGRMSDVQLRKSDESAFHSIAPEQLFHE